MNDEDWDSFINGLNLKFPYGKGYFSVSPGWRIRVAKLINDCLAAGWDGEVHQVKEKFGGLRFYVGSASNEVDKLIEEAEDESYKICSECGKEGELRPKLGWVLTLCDTCYDENLKHRMKE